MIKKARRAIAVALVAASLASHAAQAAVVDIPSGDLAAALEAFAKQTGIELVFRADQLHGLRTQGVRGELSPQEAITRLLQGTNLRLQEDQATGAMVIAPVPPLENRSAPSEPTADAIRLEEIVVTGTHIRGVAPVGSALLTIDRTEIERTGYATAAQVIQSLPQNLALGANEANFSRSSVQNANFNGTGGTGANLRGLGPASTLVLVNGRRMAPSGTGTFSDLSVLPLSAIERIEIVPDGASALYGSDAIGGVVNFILRNDYEGAETALRHGVADGFDQTQVSQVIGTTWTTGNVLASYEYDRRGELMANKRDYFTQDLRPFGGTDFRPRFANPGTLLAGGGSYAIPQGQDGGALSGSDLVAGTFNLQDQNLQTSILPHRDQHSATVSVRQELTPSIRLFAEGYYTHRDVAQWIAAGQATLTVPASNPFFVSPIAGVPSVQVQYSFLDDLGASSYINSVANFSGTAGLDLELTSRWNGQLYASRAVDDQDTRLRNIVNSAALALALADTNPLTAFNPFGDGANTNPETIGRIRGYNNTVSKFVVESASATVNGPIAALAGGEIMLAAGAEYRDESLSNASTALQSGLQPTHSRLLFGRSVSSAFSELIVPIIGASNSIPGARELRFSAAGRYEDYSDFGSTTNPKFGVTWIPLDDLSIRGSYGTSYQAPLLRQLSTQSAAYVLVPLPDPQAPGGQTLSLLYSAPGNPDLEPQKATTWSVGADFKPRGMPGFIASVNYFDIEYKNLIGSIGSDVLSALQLEHIYGSLITRNPAADFVQAAFDSGIYLGPPVNPSLVGAYVNSAPTNLGMLRENGLDASVSYQSVTSLGRIGFQAGGTLILDYDVAQTRTAPLMDRLDTINNPVSLRGRASVFWGAQAWNAALHVNYVDGYESNLTGSVQPVDSWTTVDLSLAYTVSAAAAPRSLADGLMLLLSAQNVFDSSPPFVDSPSYGYDPANASPIGRYVSVQLRKTW